MDRYGIWTSYLLWRAWAWYKFRGAQRSAVASLAEEVLLKYKVVLVMMCPKGQESFQSHGKFSKFVFSSSTIYSPPYLTCVVVHSVAMTSHRWTRLQSMCWAVWLVSAVRLCLVEDLVVLKSSQALNSAKVVVPLDHRSSPPILCMLKLSKATAQGLWVPLLLTSAKDQWMPSCFLPKNTELNTLRCIQGKITGK